MIIYRTCIRFSKTIYSLNWNLEDSSKLANYAEIFKSEFDSIKHNNNNQTFKFEFKSEIIITHLGKNLNLWDKDMNNNNKYNNLN